MKNIKNMKVIKNVKEKTRRFIKDGLQSLISSAVNRRNSLNTNVFESVRLDYEELKAIYKTGIGNKIISLKSGHALQNSIQFETEAQKIDFNKKYMKFIRKSVESMLSYGRGIIVIVEHNQMLDQPLAEDFLKRKYKLETFSGDMVTAYDYSLDLLSSEYYEPNFYSVNGYMFHKSRVIDFTYVTPPQRELPSYQFGGISEFELIRQQLVANSIVERASPSILEKNSTMFYKINDLKDLLNSDQESDVLKYISATEDSRSIYGAGIIDASDEAFVLSQSLTDLDKVDMITLRRLACVTGIPLTWLVGENAQGLNSSGEEETNIFMWMIESLRSRYILPKINELFDKLNIQNIKFKEKRDLTPAQEIDYEAKAIENANKLEMIDGSGRDYLVKKGILEKEQIDNFFMEE